MDAERFREIGRIAARNGISLGQVTRFLEILERFAQHGVSSQEVVTFGKKLKEKHEGVASIMGGHGAD